MLAFVLRDPLLNHAPDAERLERVVQVYRPLAAGRRSTQSGAAGQRFDCTVDLKPPLIERTLAQLFRRRPVDAFPKFRLRIPHVAAPLPRAAQLLADDHVLQHFGLAAR